MLNINTNRDHAKGQQRPMMEDEAIAGQLEDLLTSALDHVEVKAGHFQFLRLRGILICPWSTALRITAFFI